MDTKEMTSDSYSKYVHEIVQTFAEDMKKEYGLVCIGSGGRMPKDVEEISVAFVSHERAPMEKARELEVNAIEKLVDSINHHPKIQKFLRESPFGQNRVEISISFINDKDEFYDDGGVALVFLTKNKIVYRTYDARAKKIAPFKEERYEEARHLVQAQAL